jgi:hypothetical protein
MDLANLSAESKATVGRDSRDSFGLAGVQSDKAHRRRSAGPVTLLEFARSLPENKISFPQVKHCINSRVACGMLLVMIAT